MHPNKFGDSHDWTKKGLIHGLVDPGNSQVGWATHPMYFRVPDNDPFYETFTESLQNFLGIGPVPGNIGDVNNRRQPNWADELGRDCANHLLLDPDNGLAKNERGRSAAAKWNQRVGIDEIVAVTQAGGREHLLTLIFDQGYSRWARLAKKTRDRDVKLKRLYAAGLFGAAYVAYPSPYTVFIWVCKDERVLIRVTQHLMQESGLPCWRFVGHADAIACHRDQCPDQPPPNWPG